ncbi:MAG: hypothetical protein ACRDOB_15190 [Streptosporangiaceae bacterium]
MRSPIGQGPWLASSVLRSSGPMNVKSSPTSDCRQVFLGNSGLPSLG